MEGLRIALAALLLGGSALITLGQRSNPRTVRDYFMLLPEKYFYLEMCLEENRKKCRSIRETYLERFLEVHDKKNGYLKAGGDGAQDRITMRMFKVNRKFPLFIVYSWGAEHDSYYFLEYRNRKWFNISKTKVVRYKKRYIYEIPRAGSTIPVIDQTEYDPAFGRGNRGNKLYDLVWNGQKFLIRRTR